MMEQILEDIKRIAESDRDEVRKRFEEQLKSPAFGLSANDFADKLFRCVDATANAAEDGLLESLPTADVELIRTRIHKVADQLHEKQNPQGWHDDITTLEQELWRAGILGSTADEAALKKRVSELDGLLAHTETTARRIDALAADAGRIVELKTSAEEHVKNLARFASDGEKHVAKTQELASQASNAAAQAQSSEENAAKHEQEIETRRARIGEFFETIEEHRQKMEAAGSAAEQLQTEVREFLIDAEERRDGFFEEAEAKRSKYEDEASKLLRMATGASLFLAFDKRKRQLGRGAWIWATLALITTGGAIWFALSLATDVTAAGENGGLTPIFWVKLSTTPLFLLAIGFCVTQYAHVRRLEDAYAFKATLSVSLEPYRDLVTRMLESEEERKHLEFVIETIRQIFTSPAIEAHKGKPGADDIIDRKTINEVVRKMADIAARRVG